MKTLAYLLALAIGLSAQADDAAPSAIGSTRISSPTNRN